MLFSHVIQIQIIILSIFYHPIQSKHKYKIAVVNTAWTKQDFEGQDNTIRKIYDKQ